MCAVVVSIVMYAHVCAWLLDSLEFCFFIFFFFFQAEDGIRDAQESRGLGDVYKRQSHASLHLLPLFSCQT